MLARKRKRKRRKDYRRRRKSADGLVEVTSNLPYQSSHETSFLHFTTNSTLLCLINPQLVPRWLSNISTILYVVTCCKCWGHLHRVHSILCLWLRALVSSSPLCFWVFSLPVSLHCHPWPPDKPCQLELRFRWSSPKKKEGKFITSDKLSIA